MKMPDAMYVVLSRQEYRRIKNDPEASVSRGTRVWRSFREAKKWRRLNVPDGEVYAIYAGNGDAEENGLGQLVTKDVFKLCFVSDVIPKWLWEVARRVAAEADREEMLDSGYINPDYTTPEQQEEFYRTHTREIRDKLASMIAIAMFEEIEARARKVT